MYLLAMNMTKVKYIEFNLSGSVPKTNSKTVIPSTNRSTHIKRKY